jgi:hypothetical protein
MADFIFNLNNLGVTDVKKEVSGFVKTLFEARKIFGGSELVSTELSDIELIEWIYKVYLQMVEASGIHERSSKYLRRRG